MKKTNLIIMVVLFLNCLALAGTLTLTSPNGGESWPLGSVHPITWIATDIGQNVKLVLYKDNVWVGQIADKLDAHMLFSWTVGQTKEGTAPAGGGYTIRVRAQDNTVGDAGDAAFTITDGGMPPVVKVVPPYDRVPPAVLKFPRLEVSGIGLAPNTEGFGIVFSYKNVGNGPLPKASEVPVKPGYRVLQDDREAASGSLFIPAFAAEPGWEQTGYFGGWIKLPSLALLAHESMTGTSLYHEDAMVYRWHLGDKITVHINENEVMGMKSHSRSENLEWMAMTEGDMYDLRVHEATYDWNSQVLKIKVVLDGKIPANQNFTLMCIDPLVPDRNFSIKQAMDKRVFEFAKRVDLGDFVNFSKFDVYVIGNADNPQKNIGDVDMRNNLYILRIQRPK